MKEKNARKFINIEHYLNQPSYTDSLLHLFKRYPCFPDWFRTVMACYLSASFPFPLSRVDCTFSAQKVVQESIHLYLLVYIEIKNNN